MLIFNYILTVKSDECSESCTLMFCCEDLKNCDGHPTISMLNNFYYLTFEGLSGRGDIWFPTERTYDGLAAAIHACGCDPGNFDNYF